MYALTLITTVLFIQIVLGCNSNNCTIPFNATTTEVNKVMPVSALSENTNLLNTTYKSLWNNSSNNNAIAILGNYTHILIDIAKKNKRSLKLF